MTWISNKKLLQKERLPYKGNLKTSHIKKWRISFSYRQDLASTLSKLSRIQKCIQNRVHFEVHTDLDPLKTWNIYLTCLFPVNLSTSSACLQIHLKPQFFFQRTLYSPSKTKKQRDYKDRKKMMDIMTTDARVKRFLREQVLKYEQRILSNRGIYIPGHFNQKQNLGNVLHISDKYLKELDMDPDQLSLPNHPGNQKCILHGKPRKVQIVTLKGHQTHPTLAYIFEQAIAMVHSLFADKMIEMDLKKGCIEDEFTVDVLVNVDTLKVLGVVEYVFMRKYLWIECFAVSPEFQRNGIGKLLMDRMKSIAHYRNKSILLYALQDVIPFYRTLHFKPCEKCELLPNLSQMM